MKKEKNACPKCGSTYGYYILSRVSGYAKTTFNWDGSSGDSTDMHDGIIYRDLKSKRCCECDAIIREKLMKGAYQEEEDADIDLINAILWQSGVENINPDDELNIDLAEHDGMPPVRTFTKHLSKKKRKRK